MDLKKYILDVKDFPKKGVIFKDITPLLKNTDAFKETIDQMTKFVKSVHATTIVSPEARGFLFASAVAYAAGVNLVLVRKPGKLPQKTIKMDYSLEYGNNTLELQANDLSEKDQVVILDDIYATGGTIEAIIGLVKASGASIAGICFLADITGLNDGQLEKEYQVKSLIKY
jgi:adenine phosphoribosyltransferase